MVLKFTNDTLNSLHFVAGGWGQVGAVKHSETEATPPT